MLGLSFKENSPDLRKTRVIEMLDELTSFNAVVVGCEPRVNAEDVRAEYGLNLVEQPADDDYDAIIIAVAHDQFRTLGARAINAFGKATTCCTTLSIYSTQAKRMGVYKESLLMQVREDLSHQVDVSIIRY